MNRLFDRLTLSIVLCAALYGCGGGGAAPPSAPLPPSGTGGAPPSGTPTPPTQPTPPTPPQAPTPPASPAPPSAPLVATIRTPERTFSPSAVTIAASGTVTWQAIDDDHEIVFVSAAPPGGNLGEIEEGSSATRTFNAAGTYDFECLRHRDKGMRGTIVVQSSSSASPPPSTPPASPPPTTPPPSAPPGSTDTVTTPNSTFSPADVTIPTGGTVTWQFSGTRHNVVFQGTAPSGGNIPDQEPGATVSRTFAAPGTYSYFCARHSGMTGRVTVQ